MQLLDPGRHFGAGAAIDDGDEPAEAFGGARGVHRGVAAADDDDPLVLHFRQRRLVILEPRLHQVDAGQEFVGRHDAEQMLARHVHEARQAGAGADENLPEAVGLEILDGRRLADDEIGDEAAAEQPDLGDDVVDQRVRQAELRDAVAQDAAELVEGLEDRDRIALGREQIGVDEARGAGADHGDRRLVGLGPGTDIALPSPGRAARVPELLALGQEPFELADLDRPPGERADALALQFLRADAAGDVGQGVEAFDELERLLELARPQELQHLRDMDLDRAAALGLLARPRHAELARPVLALLVAQGLEPDEEIDLARAVAEVHVAEVALVDELEVPRPLLGPSGCRAECRSAPASPATGP